MAMTSAAPPCRFSRRMERTTLGVQTVSTRLQQTGQADWPGSDPGLPSRCDFACLLVVYVCVCLCVYGGGGGIRRCAYIGYVCVCVCVGGGGGGRVRDCTCNLEHNHA